MFKHFLVPLDGSKLAEAILPVAQTLARAEHARVTLLHVVEPAAPATIHGYSHLLNAQAAEAYLEGLAQQLRDVHLECDWHVDVAAGGAVAKAIFAHGGELDADLILMTNHGRSDVWRTLMGSIAQQVVQSGEIPVLLVKAADTPGHLEYSCDDIVVPLDGSTLYERALEPASDFARATGATMHLVVVVPTLATLSPERSAVGLLLPSSTQAMLDLAQNGAEEYIERQAQKLRESGLTVVTHLPRGNVPAQILATAQAVHADLIVMGTHGRAGFDAFWQGSIAPQVMNRAHMPVLLLRVKGKEQGTLS